MQCGKNGAGFQNHTNLETTQIEAYRQEQMASSSSYIDIVLAPYWTRRGPFIFLQLPAGLTKGLGGCPGVGGGDVVGPREMAGRLSEESAMFVHAIGVEWTS